MFGIEGIGGSTGDGGLLGKAGPYVHPGFALDAAFSMDQSRSAIAAAAAAAAVAAQGGSGAGAPFSAAAPFSSNMLPATPPSKNCCAKCGSPGHLAKSCRLPNFARFCYKCGDPFHLASQCALGRRCFVCGDTSHQANLHGLFCTRCKSHCHFVAQCRMPENFSGGRYCFRCGDPSHLVSHCTANLSTGTVQLGMRERRHSVGPGLPNGGPPTTSPAAMATSASVHGGQLMRMAGGSLHAGGIGQGGVLHGAGALLAAASAAANSSLHGPGSGHGASLHGSVHGGSIHGASPGGSQHGPGAAPSLAALVSAGLLPMDQSLSPREVLEAAAAGQAGVLSRLQQQVASLAGRGGTEESEALMMRAEALYRELAGDPEDALRRLSMQLQQLQMHAPRFPATAEDALESEPPSARTSRADSQGSETSPALHAPHGPQPAGHYSPGSPSATHADGGGPPGEQRLPPQALPRSGSLRGSTPEQQQAAAQQAAAQQAAAQQAAAQQASLLTEICSMIDGRQAFFPHPVALEARTQSPEAHEKAATTAAAGGAGGSVRAGAGRLTVSVMAASSTDTSPAGTASGTASASSNGNSPAGSLRGGSAYTADGQAGGRRQICGPCRRSLGDIAVDALTAKTVEDPHVCCICRRQVTA